MSTPTIIQRRRVLFVDDEPRILEGLVRMLRPQRAVMEVLTAVGGNEALDLLTRETVDVVVSDMRMPAMDGAELLTRVRERHPQVVRIILSGQSDLETTLRATASTHQFLAKPCDPERLKITVARACALRDLLPSPKMKELVGQRISLPADPAAYVRLLEALDGKGSNSRAAEAIAHDPAMAAKALQLVSSAFFGQPRRPHSAAEAAHLLGLDNLRALVRAETAFIPWSSDLAAGYPLGARVRLARLASNLAEGIAGDLGLDPLAAADAALAALLHVTGELALAQDPVSGCRIISGLLQGNGELAADDPRPEVVGAYLLGLWGLPDVLVDAIAGLGPPLPEGIGSAEPAIRLAVGLARHLVDGAPRPAAGTGDEALIDRWLDQGRALLEVP